MLDFVKVVDTFNVRVLSNVDDKTHIEFWYDDEYVVLYKNSPLRRKSIFEKKEQIEVFNEWKYFTFKLQSN